MPVCSDAMRARGAAAAGATLPPPRRCARAVNATTGRDTASSSMIFDLRGTRRGAIERASERRGQSWRGAPGHHSLSGRSTRSSKLALIRARRRMAEEAASRTASRAVAAARRVRAGGPQRHRQRSSARPRRRARRVRAVGRHTRRQTAARADEHQRSGESTPTRSPRSSARSSATTRTTTPRRPRRRTGSTSSSATCASSTSSTRRTRSRSSPSTASPT